MRNDIRPIDAHTLKEHLSSRHMHELFPDWRDLPLDVREKIVALGRTLCQDILNAPTVKALPIPCNIGDTVYVAVFAADGSGSHICERICSGIHISDKVTRWRHESPVHYLVLKTDDGYSIRIRMDEIGKSLFFTREDAEAALQKGRMHDAEMQDVSL